jgi:DNA-binding NtrC family response regulator
MLDLVMSKMDGFDLYKELKKQDPDVNVCFIRASGHTTKILEKHVASRHIAASHITHSGHVPISHVLCYYYE